MNSLLAKIYVLHSMKKEIIKGIRSSNDRCEENNLHVVTYQDHYSDPCFSVSPSRDKGHNNYPLFQLNDNGSVELKDSFGYSGDLEKLRKIVCGVLGVEI